jgi:PhnB protein
MQTVTTYLVCRNARSVLDFITNTLDGMIQSEQRRADGAVAHAEVQIGSTRLMIGEQRKDWPAMPTALYLRVVDVDRVWRRALDAGATPLAEPADISPRERRGAVTDAGGNQWWFASIR